MTQKQKISRQKHVPQRTCVVCREKTDKRSLTRIVRTADEGVVIDLSGKRNGRGTYLCSNPSCWENAIVRKSLATALKTELTEQEKAFILEKRPSSLSAEP